MACFKTVSSVLVSALNFAAPAGQGAVVDVAPEGTTSTLRRER